MSSYAHLLVTVSSIKHVMIYFGFNPNGVLRSFLDADRGRAMMRLMILALSLATVGGIWSPYSSATAQTSSNPANQIENSAANEEAAAFLLLETRLLRRQLKIFDDERIQQKLAKEIDGMLDRIIDEYPRTRTALFVAINFKIRDLTLVPNASERSVASPSAKWANCRARPSLHCLFEQAIKVVQEIDK